MNIEVTKNNLEKVSSDAAIVFVFKNKKAVQFSSQFKKVDAVLDGALAEAVSLDGFKGELGELLSFYTSGKILPSRILVVGLGSKPSLQSTGLKTATAIVAKSLKEKVSTISISLLENSECGFNAYEQARVMVLGFLLGNYSFTQYRKPEKSSKVFDTVIISEKKVAFRKEIKGAIDFAIQEYQAVKLARDLVNEQAAVATPTFLANIAKDIARSSTAITCTIFEEKEAQKMGMGAFLGVARGSDTPAKFIYLHYKPKRVRSKRRVALVGKGITFDSGGVSLKPSQYMTTMKCDMAGAAAVLGVFSILDLIAPSFEVMGLVAATPNLVSGSSYVPGDVLKAMNGKTIEVLNTDAEGRVTLADSLSFAIKKEATDIIDLATLTGACMVALGTDYAGMYANNKDLSKSLLDSAKRVGEKLWEMPLEKSYKKLIKSDVADVANIASTPYGGSITAALFLEEFVSGKPWIHLDIAGPAFIEGEFPLGPKGGTGFGVELLIDFLQHLK